MPEFDVVRFHAALRTKRFGRHLIFERSVGSTLDVARHAAEHDAPEGTVALADEQTAGRGRLGRTWVSPPGVNLMPTLVLRPPREVLRWIPMIPPLAIVRAIEAAADVRAAIKWPNDVHIAGRKLGGVLIETEIEGDALRFVLVGCGINVNWDTRSAAELADIATSLLVVTGRAHDREALLARFLLEFERLYDAALGGDSPLAAWRERLATLGQPVRASWPGGEVEGIAEDTDDEGGLVVRTAAGELVTVQAGDVTLRA